MIIWLNETICHFTSRIKHASHQELHAAQWHGWLCVMRLSVICFLSYKICSFQYLVFSKPNNIRHPYASENWLSDILPFPPKSIIQVQSSDQNQSNSQKSLHSDGCVVTGMKWVCAFTQSVILTNPFKENIEGIFTVDTISMLTDFKEKHTSEIEVPLYSQEYCVQVWAVGCHLKNDLIICFLQKANRCVCY